jgi:Tol biopolymer transport system component
MSFGKRELQRTFERFESPEPAFDRLVRRRERHERRKRVEAGVAALVITAAIAAAALVVRAVDTTTPADQTPAPVLQASKPGIWIVDPVSDTMRFVWGPDWLDQTLRHWGSWIGAPTMSPNGDRIAFSLRRDGAPFQLWTVSSTGQDLRKITDCASETSCPMAAGPGVWQSWSPDSRSIAFAGGPNSRENPSDIYTVRPDGTDLRKLVSLPGEEDIAGWSPDGTQIVFDHYLFGQNPEQVFIASLGGGSPALLVNNGDSPTWSPDGRWISFTRRAAGGNGQDTIWVVRPDGTGAHPVANGEWTVGWSPDGSHLAILQAQTPTEPGNAVRRYAIVDVDTGDVTTIDITSVDTAEMLFRWPANG